MDSAKLPELEQAWFLIDCALERLNFGECAKGELGLIRKMKI